MAVLPDAEIVRRHSAGESVNSLAKQYGVSRPTIERRLRAAGVSPRSVIEANRLLASQRTPEEHARNAEAAHAAVRGMKRTEAEMLLRAQVRERSQAWKEDHTSALELQFGRWLDEREVRYIQQKAIGPYNVDFACGPVAVEINGGAWHGYGEHRERAPERYRHILTAGWNLAIVWAGARRVPLTRGSADVVADFVEQSGWDSVRGEHLVVWGDGQVVPSAGFGLDDLAVIPPRG